MAQCPHCGRSFRSDAVAGDDQAARAPTSAASEELIRELELVASAGDVAPKGHPSLAQRAADEIKRLRVAAQSSFERVSVERLAKHFLVSVSQAQSAQDDIGFMYRERAGGVAPGEPNFDAAARVLGFRQLDSGKWYSPTPSVSMSTGGTWDTAEQIFEWWGRANGVAQAAPVSLEQAAVETELFFMLTSFMEDDEAVSSPLREAGK
jgi:hypothetical protein